RLSSDQILYLRDIGISEEVITAAINHQRKLVDVAQSTAPAGPPVPTTLAPTQPPVVDAEAPVYAQPPPEQIVSAPVAQYNYFYSSLAPYGSWFEVADYGWCWRPTVTVIDRGWRPYGDRGRWLYTDCGWYWQSAYSSG